MIDYIYLNSNRKSNDTIFVDRTLTYNDHIKFVSLSVNAGSLEKHEAKMTLEVDGNKKSSIS